MRVGGPTSVGMAEQRPPSALRLPVVLLLAITLTPLAIVGLWPDPNPNPIGFGLLFVFSVVLGSLVAIFGVLWTRFKRAQLDRRRGANRWQEPLKAGVVNEFNASAANPFVMRAIAETDSRERAR